MKNKFAERFKEKRKSFEFTQEKLAKLLFVKQNTIAMWENGEREPSFDMLLRICEVLETSTGYLLGEKDFEI